MSTTTRSGMRTGKPAATPTGRPAATPTGRPAATPTGRPAATPSSCYAATTTRSAVTTRSRSATPPGKPAVTNSSRSTRPTRQPSPLELITKEKELLAQEKDKLTQEKSKLIMELEERSKEIERLTKMQVQLGMEKDELHQARIVDGRKMAEMLNTILDLQGAIRTAVRVRQFIGGEDPKKEYLSFPGSTSIQLPPLQKGPMQSAQYNKVFRPTCSQETVFAELQDLIKSVLHGYNVAICAYGQTGSGKTYTMRGGNGPNQQGVIPRAVHYLLECRKELEDLGWNFLLQGCFVEIYNEEIFDLLGGRQRVTLKTHNTLDEAGGLTIEEIESAETVRRMIRSADKNRSVAATLCNQDSSRSHALLELRCRAKNEKLGLDLTSKLHLVDLAGSECVKTSGAKGVTAQEAGNINKGLFTLNLCVKALLENQAHKPYRSSKLTSLLSRCLGAGSSRTYFIFNISPSSDDISETKKCLDMAKRMSNTHIGSAVKQST